MTIDYKILSRFRGYENRQDETTVDNMNHAVLLPPSRNVLVTSEGVVQSRGGTESFGNKLGEPVYFNKYWKTNRDFDTTLVVSGKKLYASLDDEWIHIFDVNTDYVDAAIWWDNANKRDIVIIADGSNRLSSWSGAIGRITYIDGDTIGSTKHMYDFGLRINEDIIINNEKYTIQEWTEDGYAKLDKTVNADINDVFFQNIDVVDRFSVTWIEQEQDSPVDLIDVDLKESFGFTFDVVAVNKNQIWVGSNKVQRVFVSKNTDWKDFRYNTAKGRIIGEGDSLVLDGTVTDIIVEPQKGRVVISCGGDDVYDISEVTTTVSADNVNYTNSIHSVRKLLSGFDSAFLNKYSSTLIKDSIAFINRDKTVNTLSRIENLDTSQGKPLSWLVENDFNSFNLDDASMIYYKNNIYIALPKENTIMIYDFELEIWQPPIKGLTVTSIGIKNGELFYFDIEGQANWLFKGTNDNGLAFEQEAVFHYENFGKRAVTKYQTSNYTEGYISTGGKIEISLINDFNGESGITSKEIIHGKEITNPKNKTLFYNTDTTFGIGRYTFGSTPFGLGYSDLNPDEYALKVNKFRDYWLLKQPDFFEQRFKISTKEKDTVFALLAFGQNTTLSRNKPYKL